MMKINIHHIWNYLLIGLYFINGRRKQRVSDKNIKSNCYVDGKQIDAYKIEAGSRF